MRKLRHTIGSAILSIVASSGLWLGYQFMQGHLISESSLRPGSSFQKDNKQNANRVTRLGHIKKEKLPGVHNAIWSDLSMREHWGLKKTDTPRAWRITRGCSNVVVAIIDTGIDTHHPDLRNALWTNPGESGIDRFGHNKATNGIDDDDNGFIDDVHGWNFVDNNNKLTDHLGHGTHIAGIIGARGYKHGMVGIAPNSKLMILKYYDPREPGIDNLLNTIRAIHYATRMGANIINYSGGGLDYSRREHDAIKAARAHGILYVAAAGNEHTDSDLHHFYPADYNLDNIISVASIDPESHVLPSSNYGVRSVDIAAPGEDIYSTLPGGTYGRMTGTSQATAFVTGVADLVKCNNPSLTANEVKKYILATGDVEPSLYKKIGTSRVLNTYRALSKMGQGLTLTGLKAMNTINMKPGTFSLGHRPIDDEATLIPFDQTAQLSSFGKQIQNLLPLTAGHVHQSQ